MDTKYYDNAFNVKDEEIRVNCYYNDMKYNARSISGQVGLDAPWDRKKCKYIQLEFSGDSYGAAFEGSIIEYQTLLDQSDYEIDFNTSRDLAKESYSNWVQKSAKMDEQFKAGRDMALYITWSCVVPPAGKLTREAMYMSKNWMTNIWSWDHCFNAMALIQWNPQLAWDQLMIMFDAQDSTGVLPDFINDKFDYFSCTKPPIHGWTLDYMMEINPAFFSLEKLVEIYEPMSRWTEYWLKAGDEVPCYYHGNDSGWDNSTVFKDGIPVKSPDLVAFLVLQMKTLSKVADKLENKKGSLYWETLSEGYLELLLNEYWDGEKFRKYRENTNPNTDIDDHGDSLQYYLPIILGDQLPDDIRTKMLAALNDDNRFLTEFGMATESVNSPYYVSDGYWRGPIWAPSSLLMADGVRRCGDEALANKIAERFVKMANESGMAENFDAQTGEGLRDRAFTWTSSVFLILGSEYL